METKANLEQLVEKSQKTGLSNYSAWRFKIELILNQKDLFEVANGTTAKPAATEEAKLKE